MTNKEIGNNVWIAERVLTYHNYVEHVKNSITGEYLMYYVGSPNKHLSKAVFHKVEASVVAYLLNKNNITDIKEAVNYLNENGISASFNNIPFSLKKEILLQKDFNELVWNYGASGTKIFYEYQLSNEQKDIISSAWSEYENNNTGISEEKADEIINSYFESFMNKAENNKNVELPWDENISPEMQKRIDSGEIFGKNEPVDKTENIGFSKITNPFFNLLNEEQKLAVWHGMKKNVDFKGEYFDQNYDNLSNSGFDNWLIEHINHKGWEGDYPYFNLSVEHVRKHYFNDVFKEENVYFDEELLIKNIQSVKVDNTKKNFTNEIIEKIKAAGIEVVTDKDEYSKTLNRIIETNVILEMLEDNPLKIEKGRSQLNADSIPKPNYIIDIRNNQEYYVNKIELLKHKIENNEYNGKEFLELMQSELFSITDSKISGYYINEIENNFYKFRLSDHKAIISDRQGERTLEESVVIQFCDNKGRVGPKGRLIEFYYNPENLTKEKMISIINGIQDWIKTGEFSGTGYDSYFISSAEEIKRNIFSQKMTSVEYNNKEVDAFVTDKSGFVDPEKIAAIDLYGFEKAKKMWENGEPDWETRMMLQDKSISEYLNWKTPNIYKKQIDDTVYGFVHNGKIYLNPELMNSNAAVHEYTHLWDAYTQKTNPVLWGKGLEIFKNTKYWNEVIEDPNYQDIKDDENLVLSEIHSRISGDIAERVLNRIAELDGEQIKLNAIDWNTETWYYICEVMLHKSFSDDYNINYSTGLTSADLTEFLSTPLKDLINEKNISQDINMETIQKSTKLQNKSEVYIDLDTANEIVLDEEILLNDDKSVGFYAWSTNKLVEQFIPSEKRLQLADEDNNINFYFNYFDENNINMELSFYKGDVQVYESYKVSPESKGFDKLKEKLDEYCMEQEGIHVDEYKLASKERLDMLYNPITPERLMSFINIAELNTFDKEMAFECIETYKNENIPLVIDELGNVYQREMSVNLKSNSKSDLTMLNPSGCIDFYRNELERISANADEEWYAEHKNTIDELNEIEDYLVNLENTVQLTTDNAYILADYVNNNKEIFGKFFTKTNGHIPAFEDMSKELAADILETLDIGDYLVRYDEQEKKFFIYDRQAADENLYIEADAGNLLSKASDISNEWHRDDTTARENEICERLDKYLYPTESFLPVELKLNMDIPQSLLHNWRNSGKSDNELLKEISNVVIKTMLTKTELKSNSPIVSNDVYDFINFEKYSMLFNTSFVIKEPFIDYSESAINELKNSKLVLAQNIGTALQNHFKEYLSEGKFGLEKITFNDIVVNYQNFGIERSWENIKHDFNDIDFENAHDRAVEILTRSGIENDVFMLKQETVWQLLDSGYLTLHVDINSADIDRGWYSDTLDSLTEKYVNGIVRFDEIQNLYDIEETKYLKEQNIPSINEYKPLDYNNPEDVKSFASFLNNNFELSGKELFTLELSKFILEYDANIDDKPDQLTLINNELYCHSFKENMNNPQRETPDTWELYGSGKDTILEIICRTTDITEDLTLTTNEQLLQSQLNSIYETHKKELNKDLSNSANDIIESYLDKVKQNLTIKDRKIVEKVLLASQKALSNFNKDEKAIIGQFFLDSGAVSQDKLGKIITKKVIEHEKQNNKSKKQNTSYEIER